MTLEELARTIAKRFTHKTPEFRVTTGNAEESTPFYPIVEVHCVAEIARALEAVMEATLEHYAKGGVPCECGGVDSLTLGPRCRADITQRAQALLENKK